MKHTATSTPDGVLLNIHQVLENYVMNLPPVLDVERRIEVQKTTGANIIGRLREQAFNFHSHTSLEYPRWRSTEYSPSLENYVMSLRPVLDVERRIEVQKTTRANIIGRLREQAFKFHTHTSFNKMESQNVNKCCFPS
jgi:hypothetical protein